jgi:zeaxanthin glucosyltransferase
MAHIGLICPELSGHLNPMTTLGRELQRRGHQVTVVARADGRAKAEQAGLGFVVIGEREFPEGRWANSPAS